MSDAIEAAARAIYEKASNGVVKWTNVRSEERQDYFDYASAAIAAYLEAQWQPIATAPDDGRRILVCNPLTDFIAIQRADDFKCIPLPFWADGISLWQPLPEKPKEAK